MILKGIDWKSIKLLDIVDGCFGAMYAETVSSLLDKETESFNLSKQRIEICKSCSLLNDNQCNPSLKEEAVRDFSYHGVARKKGVQYNGCGCNLKCKTVLKHESCPLGKWLPI